MSLSDQTVIINLPLLQVCWNDSFDRAIAEGPLAEAPSLFPENATRDVSWPWKCSLQTETWQSRDLVWLHLNVWHQQHNRLLWHHQLLSSKHSLLSQPIQFSIARNALQSFASNTCAYAFLEDQN